MKTSRYQKRFYREWVGTGALFTLQVCVQETDLHISSDKPIDRAYCIERIRHYRRQIEAYNTRDSRFFTALKPLIVERTAPAVVQDMAAAARKANVGPMAAVAGAIAQRLGRDLLRTGCRDIIIENGGDIFLKTRRAVTVGIFAGRSKLSGRLRLRIRPSATPCGICTSSGTVGHSLSFGNADAVVITAANAALADAVATATANRVCDKNDFPAAMALARSIRGVTGALAIVREDLSSWGAIEFA